MSSILSIFVIAIIILPFFLTAAAVPERSINCYKYEKIFPDLNLVDTLPEEKEIVKCDQCFSYACYSKKNEYIFGNGCREDFAKTCDLSGIESAILKSKTEETCSYARGNSAIFDMCLKDYCNHKNGGSCVKQIIDEQPQMKIGPTYIVSNITFTQLTTPAPTTTTTTTTTTPIPTTKPASNVDGHSDENGLQNGGKDGPGGSPNEKSAASYNLVNFKMCAFTFFGIFMVVYFM